MGRYGKRDPNMVACSLKAFLKATGISMPAKVLFDKVALIGVGLIGGSIGLALHKRKLIETVVGIDPNRHNLSTARKRNAITQGTTDLRQGLEGVSFAVIAAPVKQIPRLATEVADATCGNCLITDTGSTKGEILARVGAKIRFIGSHPMAGGEQHGPQAANADLFVDRTVILTPPTKSTERDLSLLEQFWTHLGARTVRMAPKQHDRIVASVSHLPHLAAVALAAATPPGNLPQVASGWLDTTRIAASDIELWVDILCDNRNHVLKSAERFGKVWALLCGALEQNDRKALRKILRDAKTRRDMAGPADN